jgi:hypothetical protein
VEEEDAPSRAKAGVRKEAVGDRKGSPRDDDDDRPRPRKSREEDEDDRPRSRSRRDEDEGERDRPRRSRRDEEEDDRDRSRGVQRRDDRLGRSDRDDDRRDRRDRRDEEDDRERRPGRGGNKDGWRGVRLGVFFVVISNWLWLGAFAILCLGMGLFMFLGAQAFMDLMAGDAAGFGGAMQAGYLLYLVLGLFGLVHFAHKALMLVGMGLSMQAPNKKTPAMRVLIIVGFALCCLGVLFYLGNSFVFHSYGYGVVLNNVIELAGFICWLIALRMAATELGDYELAAKIMFFLIAYVCYVVLATILLYLLFYFSIGFVMFGGGVGDAGSRLGTMLVVTWTFAFVLLVGLAVVVAWYSLLLQRLRGVLTARVGE